MSNAAPDEPADQRVTADDAIRRGLYAQLIGATTHQLRQMVYGMHAGKLPPVPDDGRAW